MSKGRKAGSKLDIRHTCEGMRHACWAECRRPHSQCFVLEGGPLEQVDGRTGGTSTVFGVDTEQQVLQSQAEHSTGDSLGSQ